MQLLNKTICCPYCGETIEVLVDDSEDQDYFEDCSVCCRPISFRVSVDYQGELMLEIKRDDEC